MIDPNPARRDSAASAIATPNGVAGHHGGEGLGPPRDRATASQGSSSGRGFGARSGWRLSQREAPTIDGSLDRDLIDSVLRRHLGSIESCFIEVRGADHSLQGTATLTLHITGDGRLSAADARSPELDDERLNRCLTPLTAAMRFAAPPDGANVRASYPLVFGP